MDKVKVLYVSNIDTTRILLVLNYDTPNDIAVKAITEKIMETELYDIDKDEYFQETGMTPENFEEIARQIWYYNGSYYLDNRWEATYGISGWVEVINKDTQLLTEV
jgi:hypothetical protein